MNNQLQYSLQSQISLRFLYTLQPDGEWKISHRTFVMDWSTSSPAKDLMGLGMFEDMVKGERGLGDPVFTLWDSLRPA